jgi:TorA maturation chaperone TorD
MQIHSAASSSVPFGTEVLPPLPHEEQARADLYALIARLLLAPPDSALLASLGDAADDAPACDDHPFDYAWRQLAAAARAASADAVREEFDALFISVGVPRLNPFASLYLAGFLNEKPLAALRTDLARLGLARMQGVAEMEDHLGALCETMRILIIGGHGGQRQPLAVQQAFFDTHIAPWYARCLGELRAAEGADFYARVAALAAAFLSIEGEAFEVAAESQAG